jgi:hypothetical protein
MCGDPRCGDLEIIDPSGFVPYALPSRLMSGEKSSSRRRSPAAAGARFKALKGKASSHFILIFGVEY